MKSGLVLILLMAALAAMTLPAGAVAPTINQFPAVVIGDKEDVDAATNAVLLRYVNVANLDAVTYEPNSDDPRNLRFWYETTGAKLRVGTPIIKAPLAPDEVAALKAPNPTAPPAAKELTGGGVTFWMSLIQNAPGAGKSSATNIATATVLANGNTTASLAAEGATGKHSITLYAIDDILTSKSIGKMTFDVYSMTGPNDGISSVPPPPLGYTFEGTDEGWFFNAPPAGSILGFTGAGTKAQTSTAIGHTATLGQTRYSSWGSPVYSVPTQNMTGYYYVGTFALSATAVSAATCPGFRLLYADGYYMHVGGMQVTTPANTKSINAPFTANNKTLKLAWTVPRDLVEYGDTGKMNRIFEAANDLRSYSLMFDLIQMDTTDSGNIMLEECYVQRVVRPQNVAPVKEWGGTGTAFNAPGSTTSNNAGWSFSTNQPGFSPGTATVNDTNMTVAIAGSNTTGWVSLFPIAALDPSRPVWTTGKILRITYKVAASDTDLVPNFRMLTIPTYKAMVGDNSLGSVFWGDSFSYSNARFKITQPASPNGLPGAPKTTGSTIELYHGGHTAGTGAEEAILTPQFDLADAGPGQSYPQNTWPRPTATLTISSIKMEVFDQSLVMP